MKIFGDLTECNVDTLSGRVLLILRRKTATSKRSWLITNSSRENHLRASIFMNTGMINWGTLCRRVFILKKPKTLLKLGTNFARFVGILWRLHHLKYLPTEKDKTYGSIGLQLPPVTSSSFSGEKNSIRLKLIKRKLPEYKSWMIRLSTRD